jgi:hypothetical protein
MTNFLQKTKNYWISDASFSTLLVMLIFTVFVLPVMIEREEDTTVFLNIMFILLFFVGIFSVQGKRLFDCQYLHGNHSFIVEADPIYGQPL